MFPLRSLTIVILLAVLIQATEGNYRVITATHDQWISGDDDFSNSSSGSGYDPLYYYCMDDVNCSYIYTLDQALANLTSNVLINITTDVELSSIIPFIDLTNITITGHNNPTVNCNNSGGLQFDSCNNIKIEGVSWESCGYRSDSNLTSPAIKFTNSSTITIQSCLFQNSAGQTVVLSEVSGDVNIIKCRFVNNRKYTGHGSVIHHSSYNVFSSSLRLSISNCHFKDNEGADSLIYIVSPTDHLHYLSLENSTFTNNRNFIFYISNVIFHMYGNIVITGTKAKILFCVSSDIRFHDNSEVLFHTNGIVFLMEFSNVVFTGNSVVSFISIAYSDNGTIFYLQSHSSLIFEGNSSVTFKNIDSLANGGAINLQDYSNVTFKEDCKVIFDYINSHDHPPVMQFIENGRIDELIYGADYFKTLPHSYNDAYGKGGAVSLRGFSRVTFEGNSYVTFNKNLAGSNGGAVYLQDYSNVIFKGNSITLFNHNVVTRFNVDNTGNGGAVYLQDHSSMTFAGNSKVTFNNNICADKGGAICLQGYSSVTAKDNSVALFLNNRANQYVLSADYQYLKGGAIYLQDYSSVIVTGNSTLTFGNNEASNVLDNDVSGVSPIGVTDDDAIHNGGAIYLHNHSSVIFKGNAIVNFNSNYARGDGGAVFSTFHSNVIFSGYCRVTFNNNIAYSNGGALCVQNNSNVIIQSDTTVLFVYNRAGHDGGAISFYHDSNISFTGNSTVTLANNNALSDGGACACHSASVSFTENVTVTFTQNKAEKNGGAIFLSDKFNVTFNKAKVNFSKNSADVGGAILAEVQPEVITHFNIASAGAISFYNNNAITYGDSVFFSTNQSSLYTHLLGINKGDVQQRGLTDYITTTPYKLVLQHTAIICNEFNNDTNCTSYQVNDIMLGQVVTISGCVYDYFDNLAAIATQFQVTRPMQYKNYDAIVLDNIQVICQSIQRFDISIIGNKLSSNNSSFSYSVMFISAPILLQWKPISLTLSIKLSPCHLGFKQSDESQKCECYSENDIVICSGSTSIIKRGYWFGTVTEKGTVAICPINYCDFSCCETDNGYHQLSPERENQCAAHRTGIACGNCEEGYTLSYSADCVSVNKCTVGWTVLVVTLTVFYWMAIVIAVFAMMYYKLPIGYLYAITYYYSMIDVLLGQDLYHFSRLHTALTIISSVFKLSPQFLGSFCLVKGLSGIDIQFIHYIHPSAVSIILVIISLSAKCSRRLSAFISRGIIHVICFLLLLSYTSVAFTSLLLVRSLTFHNVDKVFTYLSPDIEYLHGRHLAYFIVAVLCTIIIVIGLPLLLLLEPFLNHKINFTKIKPLLDQFQGCYKDQYRWFAAYYMICRLVVVTIVVYSSSYFITQYILIIASVIMALIHSTLNPYYNELFNKFDGFVLRMIILFEAISIIETFSSTVLTAMAFTLVMLPLLTIISIGVIMHREKIKDFIWTCCKSNDTDDINNHSPATERGSTGNKTPIENFTIVGNKHIENGQDVTQYREPLFEIMNDTED